MIWKILPVGLNIQAKLQHKWDINITFKNLKKMTKYACVLSHNLESFFLYSADTMNIITLQQHCKKKN